MSQTLLLSKQNSPLHRLALHRLQLDASSPYVAFTTDGEACLYSLVGTVTVTADGLPLGTIGGRRSVTERGVQVVRFPAGRSFSVVIGLQGYSADLLLASVEPQEEEGLVDVPTTPYLHLNDVVWNMVGEGTHARTVAEVLTPIGYELMVGETLNIPGGISSWPPHATDEDVARFCAGETTWEEAMLFVCPKPGIAALHGVYADGTRVDILRYVANGEAHVMPLGSHALYAAPDAYLWYFWVYCGTALRKQYRKFATDIGTYVK